MSYIVVSGLLVGRLLRSSLHLCLQAARGTIYICCACSLFLTGTGTDVQSVTQGGQIADC